MMKNTYIKPVSEIEEFKTVDVVTTSTIIKPPVNQEEIGVVED